MNGGKEINTTNDLTSLVYDLPLCRNYEYVRVLEFLHYITTGFSQLPPFPSSRLF
jgi:hypothetical protein